MQLCFNLSTLFLLMYLFIKCIRRFVNTCGLTGFVLAPYTQKGDSASDTYFIQNEGPMMPNEVRWTHGKTVSTNRTHNNLVNMGE